MKRKEYLDNLQQELASLSQSEIANVLEYYNEYLNDAGIVNDDDVVNGFDTPKTVAKKIIKETAELQSMETDAQDSFSQSTQSENAGTQNSLSNFSRISIDVVACDISLIYSDKNAVEYQFSEWEKLLCCKVDQVTKTLIIKTKKTFFFPSLAALKSKGFVNIYYTDKAAFEDVSLKAISGSINANSLSLKKFECESVSGSIAIDDICASRVDCEAVSGSIRISNVQNSFSNALRAETISGRIEVLDSTFGDATLETVSGKIVMERVHSKRLSAQSTSGGVTGTGTFEGKTELNCVSGSINITTSLPFDQYDYKISSVSGRTTVNKNTFKGNMMTGKNNSFNAGTISGRINIDFEC